MHRIFIVEDDAAIAAALQKHLTTWGFDVRCAEDFRNVLAECTAFDPQLVLLDITLPFYNGYHWCQELRRVSNVPVVFISSASDNMNIVMAMNMGGDDFIAKPFDLNVLLAKIQAILRRTYDFAAPAPTLEHRGAVLNTADASLTYQGQRIELTKNDYRILQTLLERKVQPRRFERGKARCVDDLRAAGQFIEFNMARCVLAAPERLADFTRFDRHILVERVEKARLADAGVARHGGELAHELLAQKLDALPCFRADADGAKARVFIVFTQRIGGV